MGFPIGIPVCRQDGNLHRPCVAIGYAGGTGFPTSRVAPLEGIEPPSSP